ncbi:adenylate cyclase type 10-like [Athalia rosae]|uniref:adenylate cyclase type 10-like n=1 Tax=Athalia rosae TaxID=37344 RepID=UPI0020346359|nr:adenylate cyclase type 10-like [Athalia rosae]
MVPDELVFKFPTENKPKSFVGIILLADVSGLSTIHEIYKYAGQGGSISLNTTLNAYFGYMIQAVYSYGGDVIKITGNGLLALWKVRNDELVFNTLHEVITCSLRIQQAIGRFTTTVNVTLKLKLAISAGNLTFIVIGQGNCHQYLLVGEPMEEAKNAKNACFPGDLVLAGSAWGHCNPACYEYVIKDSYNVKIQRVLLAAKQHGRRKSRTMTAAETASCNATRRKIFTTDERGSVYWERVDPYEDLIVAARPAINEAVLRRIGKELKTFIIPSAVQLVDTEQPLNYLTEYRRVTHMFMSVIPSKCSVLNLIRLADDIYVLLTRTVLDRGGHVMRVGFLREGISFLTIFGLNKYNSVESDSKNALLSGSNLRSSIKKFYSVEKVSVTCDLNTLLRSDLPRSKFILQDNIKILKVAGPSSIYEFTGDTFHVDTRHPDLLLHYPILGRSAELNILSLFLDDIGLADRDHAGILLKGENGSGKSRVLDAFVTMIKSRDIATTSVTLTPDYAITPYSAIYSILTEILDIDEYCSTVVREQSMSKKLGEIITPQDFCYLNEIMRVKFPISKRCSLENEVERQTQATRILEGILNVSKVRRCILIDDIHNVDPMSWQLLSMTLNVKYSLLIASIETRPLDDPPAQPISEIYGDKRMKHVDLKTISSHCITALACQILNVQAIPQFLERELLLRTNHNPNHCQALLTAVLGHGGLQRVEMTPKKATEYRLLFSPVHMLSKISRDTLPEDVAPPLPWGRRFKIHACLLNNYHQFQYSCQSVQLRDMMKNTLTKLSPYEQGLLKCAAILGVTFTRYMLQMIMPNYSNFHTTKAITNLFNLRILYCASLATRTVPAHGKTYKFCMAGKRKTFTDSQHLLYCDCSDPQIGDTFNRRTSGAPPEELPWYSGCKFFAFKMPKFQQLIYDTIPDDERRDLHLKAIELYKVEAHKCKACGGGAFLEVFGRAELNKRIAQSSRSSKLLRSYSRTMSAENQPPDNRRSLEPSKTTKSLPRKKSNESYSVDKSKSTPGHLQAQIEDVRKNSGRESISSEGRRRVSILPFYTETNDRTIVSSESSLEPTGEVQDEVEVEEREVGHAKFCQWMKNQFSTNEMAVEKISESSSKVLRVPKFTQFRGIDFRNCQCSPILDNIYKTLLYHSKNTGNTGDHINHLIDYSAGLIRVAEHAHAIKILRRADELNKNYERFKDDIEKSLTDRMVTEGIILSLLGETYLQLGYYDKARRFTLEEMTIYSSMLSTRKILICQQILSIERRESTHQWFPGSSMAKLSSKDALERSRISACIGRLSSILMTGEQTKFAKLAVMVSSNIAEKCRDQPMTELCSYRLAMLYYRHIGSLRLCKRLEKSALKIIAGQFAWNDLQGVLVVADVFQSMFHSKLIRGELRTAIEFGFKALQIPGKFNTVESRLEILPILIQALVQASRIPEAVDLLHDLSYLAQEDVDMSSTIWYYALCLDLVLDAGVTIESVEACRTFTQKLIDPSGKNFRSIIRDPDSFKRLLTNMWLLLTRLGIDSTKYELPRDVYLNVTRHENYSDLCTVMKAVECRMLKITYFLNYKKGNTLPDIRGDVKELLERLTRASKISRFLKPRLGLLKAYMNVIKGHISKAKKALAIAQKNARRQDNSLVQASITLHKKVSNKREKRDAFFRYQGISPSDITGHILDLAGQLSRDKRALGRNRKSRINGRLARGSQSVERGPRQDFILPTKTKKLSMISMVTT